LLAERQKMPHAMAACGIVGCNGMRIEQERFATVAAPPLRLERDGFEMQ
jgi:hypothetical protein